MRAASASSAASREKSEAGQAAASARSAVAGGQPRAGQPEGEDLLSLHATRVNARPGRLGQLGGSPTRQSVSATAASGVTTRKVKLSTR